VVILDSGFCVLKAIIELKKKGVYASALIKKRRYWPRDVPGDDIRRHFDGKQVGHTDQLPGISDGTPFDIFAMKEPDYVNPYARRGAQCVFVSVFFSTDGCQYSEVQGNYTTRQNTTRQNTTNTTQQTQQTQQTQFNILKEKTKLKLKHKLHTTLKAF
jgi:hypothetical protein